jgi:hypothetical protein
VAAARDRIEGTQIPTNTPESLSTKNQRKTENKKEMNAATRNSVKGRCFLFIELSSFHWPGDVGFVYLLSRYICYEFGFVKVYS